MTLDEAIAKYNKLANNDRTCYPEEAQQLAQWLEELKSSRQELNELRKYSYVQGLSDGYINAIDDFAKLVEIWCWKHEQYNQDDLNKLMNIAEQLKAGGTE